MAANFLIFLIYFRSPTTVPIKLSDWSKIYDKLTVTVIDCCYFLDQTTSFTNWIFFFGLAWIASWENISLSYKQLLLQLCSADGEQGLRCSTNFYSIKSSYLYVDSLTARSKRQYLKFTLLSAITSLAASTF